MIVSLESVKTIPSVVTIETLAIIFSNKGIIRLIRCVFFLCFVFLSIKCCTENVI
ncbi:ABC-type phosphate transport system permease component [Bacillus thuringiensis serovar thuringiensis str. T01001]|nr:ABC-type phosphate transport system permease component [Bacillus thuringiensis Bt407]EEM33426.1 ABC-type phosphate transport system permease component [Bacillus thuringiensis serovar thuringiensis str. T01001]EEM64290.1 ABC-type phosphate transport system permease component [Bacillus thuringiensis serovar berliner ATCC 10792]